MITIQFDDPIVVKIIKHEGLESITQELKRYIKSKFTPTEKNILSDSLDKKIRMAKVTNRKKANKIQNAMESLNHLILDEDKKLSINEAKEKYFLSKDI